ncbi:MAG: glycosyltransferase family 4 protein [Acidobacteriia bacterium]|nr:glycosyltransferase family 4 protein [Terriglobia bacterium]
MNSRAAAGLEVALLTGGIDKPYAFGLAMELVSKGVRLEFIGSDEVDSPELHTSPNLTFLNLRGDQQRAASLATKTSRILRYYARLIRYVSTAKPKVFHILWNNRFQTFDRTLLMLYYKMLGKKIVLTAHNVNAAKRDSNDSFLNRSTLRIQYQLADHIFVHTEKMKNELLKDFGVRDPVVTVIPFGINNSVPLTDLTSAEAKRRLGISDWEKTILFFGRIGPYKGLEYLVAAFQKVAAGDEDYRLIIAGEPKAGAEIYLGEIQKQINAGTAAGRVLQRIEYIPDDETELYFKAADVLVIPYTEIFQSGVVFLGYSFGLPVIASDVGSLREAVIDGRTGLLCKPCDPAALAGAIETYFESDLYRCLDQRRQEIRDLANSSNSWDVIGGMTWNIYADLLER